MYFERSSRCARFPTRLRKLHSSYTSLNTSRPHRRRNVTDCSETVPATPTGPRSLASGGLSERPSDVPQRSRDTPAVALAHVLDCFAELSRSSDQLHLMRPICGQSLEIVLGVHEDLVVCPELVHLRSSRPARSTLSSYPAMSDSRRRGTRRSARPMSIGDAEQSAMKHRLHQIRERPGLAVALRSPTKVTPLSSWPSGQANETPATCWPSISTCANQRRNIVSNSSRKNSCSWYSLTKSDRRNRPSCWSRDDEQSVGCCAVRR